jgi:hypothetical protein
MYRATPILPNLHKCISEFQEYAKPNNFGKTKISWNGMTVAEVVREYPVYVARTWMRQYGDDMTLAETEPVAVNRFLKFFMRDTVPQIKEGRFVF